MLAGSSNCVAMVNLPAIILYEMFVKSEMSNIAKAVQSDSKGMEQLSELITQKLFIIEKKEASMERFASELVANAHSFLCCVRSVVVEKWRAMYLVPVVCSDFRT